MRNTSFIITKVKAHVKINPNIHERRNNIVDKLARKTRLESNYTMFETFNPDYSYYEYWFQNNCNLVQSYHNKIYSDTCAKHTSRRGDHRLLLTIDDTDALLRETRLLSLMESQYIMKLRFGYANIPRWFFSCFAT